jgi:hypothetical protein
MAPMRAATVGERLPNGPDASHDSKGVVSHKKDNFKRPKN